MYNNLSFSYVPFQTPSGNRYTYIAYLITPFTGFSHAAGNYMFAYKLPYGQWQVLYVGQTNDFAARFSNHHKLNSAIKKGATHILVRVNDNEIARKLEEFEMIAWLTPELNELLKYY